jgi:hypothetical protein
MTVCAAHLAFRDLSFDGLPRDSVSDERAYVCALIPYVIEFENVEICLATVHARMVK